jgi:hypothetical protein
MFARLCWSYWIKKRGVEAGIKNSLMIAHLIFCAVIGKGIAELRCKCC